MMRSKVIITAIIATVMFAGLAAVKHIDKLNDGIQFKQIEIQDNSAKLKQLNQKYDELHNNTQLTEKEYEKQLKQLESEKQKLEADLQAKLDAKNRAVAQVTAGTVETATAAPVQATSSCDQLRTRLAGLGVPANQLDAAITLSMRESSCRSSAVNSSSGACGEFQSYPCGKWGAPGTDGYLRAAIGYANSRYGGYNGALAFSYANNWY